MALKGKLFCILGICVLLGCSVETKQDLSAVSVGN